MLRSVVLDRHDLIAGWVAARTGYVPGGQFHAIGLLASDGFTQRIIAGVVFDNWWQATLNRASADVVKLTFSHKSMALVILD